MKSFMYNSKSGTLVASVVAMVMVLSFIAHSHPPHSMSP